MSDVKDITPDLRKLEAQIDYLEDDLEPLLENLETMSSQLPLLDKAKLYSLTAYAIESMLFSSLKLQGQDAQNHPVFTELKRIQQYFAKIKTAEEPEPETERRTTVNQEAAARMLKANLGDNKTIKDKLAEKIAEERAKALLKSLESKKRPAEESPAPASAPAEARETKKSKRSKHKSKGKDKNKSKD